MANKKTTELPENTSPNDNDKFYHVTATGVSKFIRASTLKAYVIQDISSGGGAKFRGYKPNEASILALEDPQDGEGAIDRSTNNLWVYVENDSDGNQVNQWINTGEYGPVFEIDAVPTLGNTDHVPSSHGVAVALGNKAESVHDHSIAETWLINVLANYVLSSQFNTLFWNRLKASLSQGSGIIINFTEGDKVATINAIGGEGSPEITINDTITIGDGNAVNSIAVIDYALRKVGYEEIEYAAEIELDAGTDGLRKFKITGVTGPFEITDFLSDDENIATEIYVAVEFVGVAPQPITLPGYVTINGHPITENPFTPQGEIGDTVTFVVERRVSEWELWTAGSEDIDGSPEAELIPLNDLSDVNAPDPNDGDVLTWDDTSGEWVAAPPSGGIGSTNLGATPSPTTVVISSDTGTDATIVAVDGTNAGLMLPAQKTKLDGIATGATANDTDANLKDRANHTGTQAASTISDFNTAALAAAPAETTTTAGALINGATGKTTPVDADSIGLVDSAASNILKKLTWANLKATLKTYFDTLYGLLAGANTWAAQQTFTLAPRLSSTTASKILKVDSNKDIASGDVALTEMADQAALTVLANATNATAKPTAVAASTAERVFVRNGSNALTFLQLTANYIAALAIGTGHMVNNAITLSKMAQLATNKAIANLTGSTADPQAVDVEDVSTALFKGVSSVSSYVMDGTENVVNFDNTGPVNCTFAAATAYVPHKLFYVKDTIGTAGTNNITMVPSGSDTIDQNTTITTNKGARAYYSDGVSKFYNVF